MRIYAPNRKEPTMNEPTLDDSPYYYNPQRGIVMARQNTGETNLTFHYQGCFITSHPTEWLVKLKSKDITVYTDHVFKTTFQKITDPQNLKAAACLFFPYVEGDRPPFNSSEYKMQLLLDE